MLQDSARYALYLIQGIGIEPLRDTDSQKDFFRWMLQTNQDAQSMEGLRTNAV